MKTKGNHWLKSAIIYQVLIDRFCRGGSSVHRKLPSEDRPAFCGGNLQGVLEKLDCLCDLGVNTVWLSPFNRGAAYHGYHITDFFAVDKHFGGGRALEKLVRAVHQRELKLIMDFVPNHVHRSHPWFLEACANKSSQYREWFHWKKDGSYLSFLHFKELAKLNLDHPPARAEIIRAALYWVDRGIDGIRLDHAIGPSLGFWREFRRRIKAHNPDVALIGEVAFFGIEAHHLGTIRLPNKWLHLKRQLRGLDAFAPSMREYVGVFDGLLDFEFQRIMRLFAQGKPRLSRSAVQQMLDRHYASFPKKCVLLSFLDNHDMNRFLFECRNNKARLKQAARIQFSQVAPPVIYYGTEIGMSQLRSISLNDHGDLQARQMMPWETPDKALLAFYKHLIRKRINSANRKGPHHPMRTFHQPS